MFTDIAEHLAETFEYANHFEATLASLDRKYVIYNAQRRQARAEFGAPLKERPLMRKKRAKANKKTADRKKYQRDWYAAHRESELEKRRKRQLDASQPALESEKKRKRDWYTAHREQVRESRTKKKLKASA